MDLCKPAAQGMELSTRLAALLELALEPTENVVESEAALARDANVTAHTTYPDGSLRL